MSGKDRLTPAAIMGLGDGAMSIIGSIAYATGHPGLVFWLALSGGLSATASMAGNEYLSSNSLRAAAVMGLATLAGSILPGIPYAFLHGPAALAVSMSTLLVVAVIVARLRKDRRHPYLETGVVLAAVLTVSILCAVLLPGGAG